MTTTYKWQGIDTGTGKLRKGRIESENATQARRVAEKMGIVVVKVKPVSELWQDLTSDALGKKRANNQDRAALYRSLAMAAATERPLAFALRSAMSGLKKRSKLRPSIERMLKDLAGNATPYAALKGEEAVLGPEAAAVYHAASQTGTPETALEELSAITEQTADIAGKVRVAMVQPTFYMAVTLLATIGLLLFVMPSMAATFADFGGEMPALTRAMMDVSDLLRGNLAVASFASMALVVGMVAIYRRPPVRMAVSKLMLVSPIVGTILRGMSTQRICALMGVMLSADVPHDTALRITADSVRSPAVKEAVLKAADDLRNVSLATSVQRHLAHIDPGLEALAEQSASGLADAGANWSRYGAFKHRDTDRKAAGLTDALQPLLLLVVGGLIFLMIAAFYMPMFSVYEVVTDNAGL